MKRVSGKLLKLVILLILTLALSACGSLSPQRYTAVPDNTPLLRAMGPNQVKVERVTLAIAFSSTCRGGVTIDPPVNMTFEEYVRSALADELKVAGLYSDVGPRIVLTGTIDELSFSSTKSVTQGEWHVGLKVTSSNGRSLRVSEHYQFESGFSGESACRRTAEAFLPAVQNLIAKLIRSAEFRALIGS